MSEKTLEQDWLKQIQTDVITERFIGEIERLRFNEEPVFRFKRLHPDAVPPTKAHPTDAGYDLTAFSREYNDEHRYWEYGTGIAVEIPEGFVGLLFPRSSISKTNLTLANSVGCVDAGFRGEVKLRFREAYRGDLSFPNLRIGDRCGQLVIVPIFTGEMIESDELSETPRGEGGFGSSGI